MQFHAFHTISAENPIDRESGVIKGVAIMSIGPALGHGMLVDMTTLEQVMGQIKQLTPGLRVKFNPETFDHGKGGAAGHIPAGTVYIETATGILRGDLHLVKSYAHFDYLCDLAETMGPQFGLSIEFGGESEDIGGSYFARCDEIYAVAVVDEPAANKSGLFGKGGQFEGKKEVFAFRALDEPGHNNQKQENQKKTMTEEDMKQFKTVLSEGIKPLSELQLAQGAALTALSKTVDGLQARLSETEEPDTEDMSDEEIKDEQVMAGVKEGETGLTAYRKVNTYRAGLNKPVTGKSVAAIIGSAVAKAVLSMGGNQPARPNYREGGNNGGNNGEKDASAQWNAYVKIIETEHHCSRGRAIQIANTTPQGKELFKRKSIAGGVMSKQDAQNAGARS